jgi:hypothetical protein
MLVSAGGEDVASSSDKAVTVGIKTLEVIWPSRPTERNQAKKQTEEKIRVMFVIATERDKGRPMDDKAYERRWKMLLEERWAG